jgi:hypothetical protein
VVLRRGGWPCAKWNRSSPEDFCLYSLLTVHGISEEIDQELHEGLLLIFLIRSI